MTKFAIPFILALICAFTASKADNDASYVDEYDLEFYNDFVAQNKEYYNKYYSFLVTHIWDIPLTYTQKLNAIFGGADFTSIIEGDDGLATVLYDMATEFPWYSNYAATASISRIALDDEIATTSATTAAAAITISTTSSIPTSSTSIVPILSTSSPSSPALSPSTITSAPLITTPPPSTFSSAISSNVSFSSGIPPPSTVENSTTPPEIIQTSTASTGGSSIMSIGIAQTIVITALIGLLI